MVPRLGFSSNRIPWSLCFRFVFQAEDGETSKRKAFKVPSQLGFILSGPNFAIHAIVQHIQFYLAVKQL